MNAQPQPASAPPVLPGRSRWQERWQVWTIAAGLLAAVLLWWQEPHGQFYFPQCWLYTHTGLQCPGCGGLRCAHALLHGELHLAWHYNPLAVLLAPVAAWWAAAEIAGAVRGRRYYHPFQSGRFWTGLGIAAVLFGVVRNLVSRN